MSRGEKHVELLQGTLYPALVRMSDGEPLMGRVLAEADDTPTFRVPRTALTLQDLAMIAGYGIVMLGVCMLACLVPTRRALNIEPTIALRTE